jgi:hypothetical protein
MLTAFKIKNKMEEIQQTIKQEIDRALSFEDRESRILALDECFEFTNSLDLPDFLKQRIQAKIKALR